MTGFEVAGSTIVPRQSLAGRILDGQGHLRYLATPDGLRDASQQIADAAATLGCLNVVSVSQNAAGPLAAAALLNPSLRLVSMDNVWAGEVDKVLLVETVAVSGQRVRAAVVQAIEAGASWVGVVVLFPMLGTDELELVGAFGIEAADAVYLAA
jgi:hypothetical protein